MKYLIFINLLFIASSLSAQSDWANMAKYHADDSIIKNTSANFRTVVFMGNSITEGWLRSDSLFFNENHFINRGISGQTTPQMLVRFRQDVIDLKPKVVVILAGTNDIAGNTGPTTLEIVFGNIVSMIELSKVNHIRVILCSVLPAFEYPWRPGQQPAEKIISLNKMLKDYSVKNGVIYIDFHSYMTDERHGMKPELSTDGVHPNINGYRIMEPIVQNAIEAALKEK